MISTTNAQSVAGTLSAPNPVKLHGCTSYTLLKPLNGASVARRSPATSEGRSHA